jgi:hypothetical protein
VCTVVPVTVVVPEDAVEEDTEGVVAGSVAVVDVEPVDGS